MPDALQLPAGARLFHIGIPKSGTTSLQAAARASRDELRRNGVLYPGSDINHRLAVLGFMGRRWGTPGAAVPPRHHWDELMVEVEAESKRRVLISHEFASESDDDMAAQFMAALGERTHVVVTLRSPGAILPSAWQQYVKTGIDMAFDDWLAAVLADPPDRSVTGTFHDRNDQGAVVRRWAEAAGPDRVTVVVLDRTRPRLLFDTFEQLLGAPSGILTEQDLGGFASNRSLSVAESELFRSFNARAKPHGVGWDVFERVVRSGALARVMDLDEGGDERLAMPAWAAERAAELGASYAETIAATGARVVGDLETLAELVPARTGTATPPPAVSMDLAAEAMAGMYSAAAWRGPFFGEVDQAGAEQEKALRIARVKREASRFTMGEIVRLGFWFLGSKLRRVFKRR